MSQYFKAGDLVLWSPSTAVAQLFVRTAEAIAPDLGLPTGIGPEWADEYEIDIPVFSRFVDQLIRRYSGSGHAVLRSLLKGFTATALVMLQRAGGSAPALDALTVQDGHDLSVGTGIDGIAPPAGGGDLRQLAAELARTMPH